VADAGLFNVFVESSNVEDALSVMANKLEADDEVMHELADYLASRIRDHFDSRSFTPVKPETIERRRWPFRPRNGIGARPAVSSTRPLVASGGARDRIVPRSRAGYAAAKRGKDDWYLFLHDRGKGRVDTRQVMDLDASEIEHAVAVYDDWLGVVIGEDAS
jgi:hypothetical protein